MFNRAPCPIIHCLHRVKKEGTIQYGYRKWELMQECFPKHSSLAGNSKNEIRQRNRRRGQEEGRKCGKKQSGDEKKKSRRPITS